MGSDIKKNNNKKIIIGVIIVILFIVTIGFINNRGKAIKSNENKRPVNAMYKVSNQIGENLVGNEGLLNKSNTER